MNAPKANHINPALQARTIVQTKRELLEYAAIEYEERPWDDTREALHEAARQYAYASRDLEASKGRAHGGKR